MNLQEVLQALTLPEKAALVEGYQSWMTNPIPRLNIPAIHLTDGPIGVRKKAVSEGAGATGLGFSLPSTAFPTSVSIANSWDLENAECMGRAIGEECVGYDVQVLLGPALNLKRDPRCGRNFEYYAEDPLLAGKMAAAFVRGVQATGTAACPKHFALNNNESYRYLCDAAADERAMRELYLKAFEICIKESHPRTIMCSYNKVNGEHTSQHPQLLTDILRKEWGFDGLTMTDWGASVDRVKGVAAGMDLDMPGGQWTNRRAIIEAVENGTLAQSDLDRAVGNVLRLIDQSVPADPQGQEARLAAHAELAIRLAEDCAVLLQNDGILPLRKEQRIAAVGDLFEKMRYQGAGSSGLNPARLISPKTAFDTAGLHYCFAQGYREIEHTPDEALEAAALQAAETADVILFFGGLTELFESEGFDRKDLCIPANQLQLMDKLCAIGKPVVAVLFGGSAFELPFAEKCSAILHMFLPGQGGGEACRKLLWGEVNPSGKLSETWMNTCADLLYGDEYGKRKVIPYRESIYVGYRYFDQVPDAIRFPFGHGLSYTSFHYSDLQIGHIGQTLTAALTVTNTGSRAGREIVQLYAGRNDNAAVFKAEKELKAFAKLTLQPGESQRICLSFTEEDLAYYHTARADWVVENGTYPILIGASSRDIRLRGSVEIRGRAAAAAPYAPEIVAAYHAIAQGAVNDAVFEQLLGRSIPEEPALYPFTPESPISDFRHSGMGRFLYRTLLWVVHTQDRKIRKMPDGPEKDTKRKNQQFVLQYIPSNCPRALVQSSGGMVQMPMAHAMTALANGKLFKAIACLFRGGKRQPLPCESKKK